MLGRSCLPNVPALEHWVGSTHTHTHARTHTHTHTQTHTYTHTDCARTYAPYCYTYTDNIALLFIMVTVKANGGPTVRER